MTFHVKILMVLANTLAFNKRIQFDSIDISQNTGINIIIIFSLVARVNNDFLFFLPFNMDIM